MLGLVADPLFTQKMAVSFSCIFSFVCQHKWKNSLELQILLCWSLEKSSVIFCLPKLQCCHLETCTNLEAEMLQFEMCVTVWILKIDGRKIKSEKTKGCFIIQALASNLLRTWMLFHGFEVRSKLELSVAHEMGTVRKMLWDLWRFEIVPTKKLAVGSPSPVTAHWSQSSDFVNFHEH